MTTEIILLICGLLSCGVAGYVLGVACKIYKNAENIEKAAKEMVKRENVEQLLQDNKELKECMSRLIFDGQEYKKVCKRIAEREAKKELKNKEVNSVAICVNCGKATVAWIKKDKE